MDLVSDVNAIDQIRQRLVTLSGNIRQLNEQIPKPGDGRPMPSWNQITISSRAIAGQLKAIQEVLADDEKLEFLRVAHAYPTATFPWHEQEVMGQLLRKRLEPDISSWANKARIAGIKLERDERNCNMAKLDWEELWNWAAPESNKIAREVLAGDNEEEDGDDEESNGDEIMDEVPSNVEHAPALAMEDVLRYMSLGSFPPPKPAANGFRR